MAYKLIWSPASRDDLRDIVTFISRDSHERAETFGYRLITATDKLKDFPEMGRIVPEYGIATIREIMIRPDCLPGRSRAQGRRDRTSMACG